MQPYSIYIHIPFCTRRCGYCDFNSTSGRQADIPIYVDALCEEIRLVSISHSDSIPIHTIFFGGGTPSLLPVQSVSKILDTLKKSFRFQEDAEITLEANPGTVSLQSLSGYLSTGVNRISFGMQSANPQDLSTLQRSHTFHQVCQAVEWSRQAGFNNLSLDLIYGIPHQDLERWQETLKLAASLHPDHLSLYALTLEEDTPLAKKIKVGLLPALDEDLAAEMYDAATAFLDASGFQQYEVSNWAGVRKDGQINSCRHNLQYWRNLPYLGFGPGAHGFAGGQRLENLAGLDEYIQVINQNPHGSYLPFPHSPATLNMIPISKWDEIQETMMVGLRLTQEGISLSGFFNRFGIQALELFGEEIETLLKQGLLEMRNEGDTLRLSQKARLVGNQVFMRFVGKPEPPALRE